ncbi:D-serine ammonia-lyase [Cupriavidus nantongensis]|uniref:D-serine ammonia-lyase n=1 Tax=Cupriavidus nantongensis TaxID=1796606 RepID=UPI0022484C61|nr:D-serine ammonia-lyase [Cupriavidus nantongensis]
MAPTLSPPDLVARLQSKEPLLWLNPNLGSALPDARPSFKQIVEAEQRLERCEALLANLFPDDICGPLESRLDCAAPLKRALMPPDGDQGAWFLKRDDTLPVAGSIKARGGFHEVLAVAESIAMRHGLPDIDADARLLASAQARALFARHRIAVGSTGNLGLSIGVLAAAFGFEIVVHMSSDAKPWKKERLRQRGVQVVEHDGSYSDAVAAGREEARALPHCHFVDDEHSLLLFLGYAAAARPLARQLAQAGRVVDAGHPLVVYIPCGVGGAPGGIAYGLKALFGPHVHCFFAEPVASPCMLVQLAAAGDQAVSIYDIGLDNKTDADGLAVGQASLLVSPLMASQLSGIFTVSDEQLYRQLQQAKDAMDIDLEPSAAAAISGPSWLCGSVEGRAYVRDHELDLDQATHVIWATGGSLVPREEHRRFQAHAQMLANRSATNPACAD